MSSTASILNTLGNSEVFVTRWGKGKLVGGKLKASKLTPFKLVNPAVQPLNGREIETMPDNRRQSYMVKLYTAEKLLVSDDKISQRADLLMIDGEEFEVFQVSSHRGLGLSHFKSFAARRND